MYLQNPVYTGHPQTTTTTGRKEKNHCPDKIGNPAQSNRLDHMSKGMVYG